MANQIEAQHHLESGNAFLRQQNYIKASEEYQKATEIDSKYLGDSKYLFNWNNILENHYNELLRYLKDDLDVNLENAKIIRTDENRTIRVFTEEKSVEIIIDEIKKKAIIKISDGRIGNLQVKEENGNLNIYYLKYATAFKNWGVALFNLKKYEAASDKYQKAYEIDPDNFVAYNNCGNALAKLKKYEEAFDKYQTAAKIYPKYVNAFKNWGYALFEFKKYNDAIDKYLEVIQIDPDDIYASYAYHNIADILWKQGKYPAGWKEWEKVCEAYKRTKQKAKNSRNADYFLYFGSVMHEIFREFNIAEGIYREGLELKPDHVGILAGLVNLYLEIRDENVNEETTTAYWKAWEAYKKAEGILKNQEKEASTLLQLGKLCLAMEDYDEAESNLLKSIEKDKESAETYTNLGVLYSHKEDFKQAVQYFKDALRLDPYDLGVRNILAAAYLKNNLKDKAEDEYRKILNITPYHVDSYIGLGKVYTVMGEETKDEDMYNLAIINFNKGINISQSSNGSKIFNKKELAAALYSMGYARVKLYEASKTMKEECLLQDALEDFKKCSQNDPYNHKAKRAKEKIDNRLSYSSTQRIQEKFGPWWIFLLSLFVFVINQSIFLIGKPFIIIGKPIALDVSNYIILTSGSIILMIIGLYLPQILKLKIGNIELEKSPVQQITTPLGISTPHLSS